MHSVFPMRCPMQGRILALARKFTQVCCGILLIYGETSFEISAFYDNSFRNHVERFSIDDLHE